MSITGTIMGGEVILDGPISWPDGTEVALIQRPPVRTEKEELAILRKSIADMHAGEKGRPYLEVFEEISREMNFPPLPAE